MSRIVRGTMRPDHISSPDSTENTNQTAAEANVAESESESDTTSASPMKQSTEARAELQTIGNLQQIRLNEILNEAENGKLQNPYIAKWEGPDLNASGNDVAIESIEISHEGIELSDDDD